MFVKKYYKRYKKISNEPKIKDDNVFDMVKNLLSLPWILGGTKDFLLSIKETYEDKGVLTQKQIDAVKNIEAKNADETIEKYNDWVENYGQDEREIAEICAHYYKSNPPYFADLSNKILSDDDFVPSRRQYISMCENKFASKVVEATRAEPKYEVGMIVKGRKKAPANVENQLFSIIKVNAAPVRSAAKGAKLYELLPFGKTQTVFCEERHIRKTRKSEA
tara:strand:+ start:117 stop:776 length:660 start_codon:yes stop_codon:yes gene_type:complete